MSHLTFLPEDKGYRFFAWGHPSEGAADELGLVAALCERGTPARARVVDETLDVREVDGTAIGVLDALPVLAAVEAQELERAPASVAAWSLAAKLALELVGRERIVPRVVAAAEGTRARFGIALSAPEDAARVAALAAAMPPAAHAVPVEEVASASERKSNRRRAGARARAPVLVWAPEALLRAFLDSAADAIARAAALGEDSNGREARARKRATARNDDLARAAASALGWEQRFAAALVSPDGEFRPEGFRERTLVDDLEAWARPARGGELGAPRACFRLELPESNGASDAPPRTRSSARHRAAADEGFRLRYFLQAGDDPSLLVPAADVWRARGAHLRHLGRTIASPQEHLLRALGLAARLFPPIGRSLAEAAP